MNKNPDPFDTKIIQQLKFNGYADLSFLRGWLDDLSPLQWKEAWEAFKNERVVNLLRSLPEQRQHFFLDDANGVDENLQLDLDFVRKAKKCHLTVVENADVLYQNPLVPIPIREYLKLIFLFIRHLRLVLEDNLPTPKMPAIIKVRIFEYEPASKRADAPLNTNEPSMRPHCDGSLVSFIAAPNDGRLQYHHGQWRLAGQSATHAFGIVMPGVCAPLNFGVRPTPHAVSQGNDRRVSLTAFWTPVLPRDLEAARRQASCWRLLQGGSSNGGEDQQSFAE